MAKVILGKVAISWKNVYNGSTTYNAQDVVIHNNQCYICTTDATTGQTPPNNSWELFTNSPIDFASNEFDLIFKNENNQLSVLPIGADDSVLGIDYYTKTPTWQKLQFQLGSRIQRFANEKNQDVTESTCFVIDTNDRLRAWGNGSNYHLGIGSNASHEMLPIHVAFPQDFSGVSKLYSSNQTYIGVIDNDGKWWVWGKGSTNGSVGLNISTDLHIPKCLSDVSASNSIYGKTIVQSTQKIDTVGDKYNNLLLDSAGDVHYVGASDYFLGGAIRSNYEDFTALLSLPKMTKIASNGKQEEAIYYMLSITGEVYSFGYGGNGERGDGFNVTAHMPPLNQLAGLTNIEKIYGAPKQGYAIDTTGKLYSWGKNNFGQLGIGNSMDKNTPQANSIFDGSTRKAIEVYYNNGSTNQTIIVTSTDASDTDHKTHFCGNNFNATTSQQTFSEIPELAGKVVTHVACIGGNSTGAINTITALFLTSDNELWVVGYGDNGQLGDGKGQSVSTIQELIHIGKDIKIVDIHGFGHNENSGFCLLDENGRLFYMGSGLNMKSSNDEDFSNFTLQEIVF